LAEARKAIEEGHLTVAAEHVAEAQGRLGAERASLPGLATDIDRTREEIKARQDGEERLQEFLKDAKFAQTMMPCAREHEADRVAEKALKQYGVLDGELAGDDWLARLEKAFLTGGQKKQGREEAYCTLVSPARL